MKVGLITTSSCSCEFAILKYKYAISMKITRLFAELDVVSVSVKLVVWLGCMSVPAGCQGASCSIASWTGACTQSRMLAGWSSRCWKLWASCTRTGWCTETSRYKHTHTGTLTHANRKETSNNMISQLSFILRLYSSFIFLVTKNRIPLLLHFFISRKHPCDLQHFQCTKTKQKKFTTLFKLQ